MKKEVPIIAFFLAFALTHLQGARIKIQLEKESVERYRAHFFKQQTANSSCDDSMMIDRGSLNLPGMLNELHERVTFYRSATATHNLDDFQNMHVPLTDYTQRTIRDVITVLRSQNCPPFFFGGVVRDQYLGGAPNDADVEADCTIEQVYDICVSTWGEKNCERSESRPIVHIGEANQGEENVDVASTDLTFYANISNLEYTVNSMAYDLNGNDVIIDLTGMGQRDACSQHIRIPSDDDSFESWNEWLTSTNFSAVFRFWKLRSKGLSAFNTATQEYIVSQAKVLIGNNRNKFLDFYCSNVYGSKYNSTSKMCTATASTCENSRSKAMAYNTVFADDFGSYWTDEIEPNLPPPMCVSATVTTTQSAGGTLPIVVVGFKLVFSLLFIACTIFI